MPRRFQVGDRVSWNSEAGRVTGHITRVVTSQIQFKDYTVHASPDDPPYEIKTRRITSLCTKARRCGSCVEVERNRPRETDR